MNSHFAYPIVRGTLAVVCIALSVTPLHAQATYTVTKAADTDDGVCDADCSLREAIAAANANPFGPPDRIEFLPSLAGQTIAFAPGHGQLVMTKDVTIDADGLDITVDARGQDRVFNGPIEAFAEPTFIGLTITGGYTSGFGGGIHAYEATLRRCTVTGNYAEGAGGGIYGIWLSIEESTISRNVSASEGGGVYHEGEGFMSIERSTISGNQAGGGGGGISDGSALGTEILRSTVTRNNSEGVGGGVNLGFADIMGSIVAGNTRGGDRHDPGADCDGLPTLSGGNVTGEGTGCGPQRATVEPEAVFTQVLDPLLAPNAGVVRTHALLTPGGDPAANPAIDVYSFGGLGCVDGDGDGQPRCDAGSYEHRAADEVPPISVEVVPDASPVVVPAAGGSFTFTAILTNNTAGTQSGDVWSAAVLPNNVLHQPLLGPVRVTLAPGQTLSRTLVQTVPGTAPAGAYAYLGYAGDFAYQSAVDRSSIEGAKAAGRQGSTLAWTALDATTGAPVTAGLEWNEAIEAGGLAARSTVPGAFGFASVYPNPFERSTTLGFALPSPATVRLAVYDVLGRTVAVLVDGEVEAGRHTVGFDADGLAGGVYLVRLEVGGQVQTQRITLLR